MAVRIMGKKDSTGNERARQMVAQEAARLIVTHGIRDYRMAKIKAAERLGLNTRGSLPGNPEVERAIEEHHQLFGGDSHADLLHSMRNAAILTMEMLSTFNPQLVGPVLIGTADENSAVNLHVFTDTPELVAAELDNLGISFRTYERRLKISHNQSDAYPGFEFGHEDTHVQATVFPVDGIRQAPLSPIDGRPMDRADAERVSKLK